MRLVYAMLADEVTPQVNGKLTITGAGFDTIFAPAFPVVHPQLALVWQVELASTECDVAHNGRVDLLGPDGAPILALAGAVQAPRYAPEPHRPAHHTAVMNFQGLPFAGAGDYGFHILVNNMEIAVVPLYLRLLTESTPPAGS